MDSNEQRITKLVEKYSDSAFRLAYSYTKNRQDAEDAVQETFIRLIENRREFESSEHEKAWILRVTINVCKNLLKQYWNRNTEGLDDLAQTGHSDSYPHDNAVFQAVMDLPEKYRTVVHLYYYEGFRTGEIAKITGKRESSIRSALHRARAQLRTILKEEYDFERV